MTSIFLYTFTKSNFVSEATSVGQDQRCLEIGDTMRTSCKMEICGYRFTWNTAKLVTTKVNSYTESEEFLAGVRRITKFRLILYPEGHAVDGKYLFSVSLKKIAGPDIEARCFLTCVEEHGTGCLYSTVMHHSFYEGNEEVRFKEQRRTPFSSTVFTIKCELSFHEDQNTIPYCTSIRDYLQLSSDVTGLVDDVPESKRVVLIPNVPGNTVAVGLHREIAMCRWLRHEAFINDIYVQVDAGLEEIKEMVNYSYLCDFLKAEKWTIEFATDLYLLALSYDVNGLEHRLIRFFSLNLTRENVWFIYIIAKQLVEGGILQSACMGFIAKHSSLFSSEFRKLCYEASKEAATKIFKLQRSLEGMDLPYLTRVGHNL